MSIYLVTKYLLYLVGKNVAENNLSEEQIEAINAYIKVLRDLGEEQDITLKRQQKYDAELAKAAAALVDLRSGTINAGKGFAEALMSSTTGLSKYNAGLESLSKGVAGVVEILPGFGKVAALAITAISAFASAMTKQADQFVKSYNDLAKAGVGAGQTYNELTKLANKAGYTADNIDKFSGAFKSLGSNVIALGGTTKGALDKFAKLTDMTGQQGDAIKKQMDKYMQLGYSQEEYTQAQAETISYIVSTGQSLSNYTKNQKTLSDATGDYLDNLTKLSTLTGQSVEQQKKQQEEASRTVQMQQHQNKLAKEAEQYRKFGGKEGEAKAKDIEQRLMMEKAMLAEALRAGGGDKNSQQYAAAMEYISSGTVHSKLAAGQLASNPNYQQDMARNLAMRNAEGKADVSGAITSYQQQELAARNRRGDIFGTSVLFSPNADQFANNHGMGAGSEDYARSLANASEGKTPKERAAEADATVKPKEDSVLDTLINERNASRFAKTSFSGLQNYFNPYIAALVLNTAALGAATVALYVYGGKAKDWGKGVLDALKKGGGGAGGAAAEAGEVATAAEGATAAEAAGGAATAAETVGGTAAAGGAITAGAIGIGAAGLAAGGLLAYGGNKLADYEVEQGNLTEKQGAGVSLGSDVGGGAVAGAVVGSVVMPIVGTAIGAAVGAGLGGIYGLYRNWGTLMNDDKKKIEQKGKIEENLAKAKGGLGTQASSMLTNLPGASGAMPSDLPNQMADFSDRLNDAVVGLDRLTDSFGAFNDLLEKSANSEEPSAANLPGGGIAGGGYRMPSPGGSSPSASSGQGTTPSAPPGSDAAGGKGSMLAGVKSDVLSKKAQLEKAIGRKLVVTSGFRPGVANHGTGDALDFGLNSNSLSEGERNQLFSTAIGLGFTGLGAEYNASGGPHIHLDTSHRALTGWGSDYTSRSLPKDSPYLASLIGSRNGVRQMAFGGITNGISIAGEAGREAVVPLPNGRSIPVELISSKHPQDVAQEAVSRAMSGGGADMGRVIQDMSNMNKELVSVMKEGFREMVNNLEKSNRLQDKLVKYSM